MSGRHRNRYRIPRAATVGAVFTTVFAVLAVLGGAMVGAGRSARANGAFPDAQSVLLARDRPRQIVLAANFGLVWSEDDGQTWAYTCESAETSGGFRYTIGPPSAGGVSGDRIYAVSNPVPGAPVTADDACSWTQPGGDLLAAPGGPDNFATDVFPDPSNPARVFLLAIPDDPENPDAPGGAYRSIDGGRTYSGPIFTAAAAGRSVLTGIEVSASSAGTVYITWYDAVTLSNPTRTEFHPHLARSLDGGDTWTDRSIADSLGMLKPYLAAIDPTDPQVVFLRTISDPSAPEQKETLAVTRDGGATWTVPVSESGGALQGFVRRKDGIWFALARPASPSAGVRPSVLYQSGDGGRTFTSAALAFHGKGLAERDGTLFLATDNVVDLVALVSSTDGTSWKPRLRFEDISAIKACVYASCRDTCDVLLGNAPIFSPEVCSRASTGTGGQNGQDGGPGTGGASGGGGCGCAIRGGRGGGSEGAGGPSDLASAGSMALVVLGLVARPRRRRF